MAKELLWHNLVVDLFFGPHGLVISWPNCAKSCPHHASPPANCQDQILLVIEPLKTSGDGFEMRDLNSLGHFTAPESGFVDELQLLGFPHTCHPSYGGLALTPAGFDFLLNTLALFGHTQLRHTTG